MKSRLIGLTGGIASGKSVVAEFIREYGIPVINLDEIGKEVTGPHLAKDLAKATGTSVLKNGKIDRAALRTLIFNDAKVRKAVEKVLHPLILKEFESRCDALKRQGKKIIVCEAALLVESGHYKDMDELIVVTAPESVRRDRVGKRDKINEALIEKIFCNQTSDAEKLKVATVVILNDGSKTHLKAQVEAIVSTWKL